MTIRWLPLALLLACAHDPKLPPPDTDEARDAVEELEKQHDYFEGYMTTARRDCPRRCTLANAVCQKAHRVCEIAEGSPKQAETLGTYCQAAQGRCEKVNNRLRSDYCPCWSTGPRVD